MNALPYRLAAPFEGPMLVIARAVAHAYGVRIEELRSHNRSRHLIEPRHICYFMARSKTGKSFPEIGRFFDRDHTTIMYGVVRIEDRICHDPELQALIRQIQDHPDIRAIPQALAKHAFDSDRARLQASLERTLGKANRLIDEARSLMQQLAGEDSA